MKKVAHHVLELKMVSSVLRENAHLVIPVCQIIWAHLAIHHTPSNLMRSLCYVGLVLASSPSSSDAFLLSPIVTATTAVNPHGRLFLSDDDNNGADETSVNVLGTQLLPCCTNVRGTGIGTGFYRNGYCSTGEQDLGRHTVCVRATQDFLNFSRSVGNDLSTPVPEYMFPGLQEGDIWCLCALRWVQAYEAGMAPQVYLQSTHEKTLNYVPFDLLRDFAIDKEVADDALQALNQQRDKLRKLMEE